MYSRNYSRGGKYSPPPGYTGSTFDSRGETKHHPPENEVVREKRETAAPAESLPREKDNGGLAELLRNLRGRFGSEELIILAVMLLIAQDGVGAEVLILALILIAG